MNAARAHNDRGVLLQRSGDFASALAEYRLALELDPGLVEAHNNVGTLLGAMGEVREALAHFQAALALRPDLVATHANIAVARYLLGDLAEAEAAYRRVLDLDPRSSDALGHLGEILLERGLISAARAALASAIALSPRTGWLYRRWADAGPVAPGDAELASMQASIAEWTSLPQDDRMQLHFAFAKAYDDLGAYRDAFRHATAANRLKRLQVRYDENAALAFADRIEAAFSPELFSRLRGAGDLSDAPIFVIGMPRSGTTLVEQILASHPRVSALGERDEFELAIGAAMPGVFPENVAGAAPEDFTRIGERYVQAAGALAGGTDRFTDKMPLNFRFAGAIHLALPNAKIVHVRRDARDCTLSCFFQLFNASLPFAYDLGELGRYYRSYASLVEHWRRVLPSGTMLELRYEELVGDFRPQAARLLEFCGLDWNDACERFYAARRPVGTASAVQVRRPLYGTSAGRWRRYEPYLVPLLEALGDARTG